MANRAFPESCLEQIIERAIEEGCLFELLFTEKGRQLWRGWSEDQIRNLVFKKLRIKSKRRG
ncbi:TPA: hypothetical protein [Aquificae Conch Spring virus]|nr:TPA: hypothetical protein [Aquificae Conch Spring virus]